MPSNVDGWPDDEDELTLKQQAFEAYYENREVALLQEWIDKWMNLTIVVEWDTDELA